MTSKFKISAFLLCVLVLSLSLTSCLGGSDAETVVTNWQNATVKSFSFSDNSDVCSNLSNYSFTIDNFGTSDPELSATMPNAGIIFNPDSLPVGTVPDSITISMELNSASSVIFSQFDDAGVLKNTTNFADTQYLFFDKYAVTRLDIVSYDASVTKSYFIKVNVHKVHGDTIRWQYLTKDVLPVAEVSDQKTIALGENVLWFTEHTDGSVMLSSAKLSDVADWSAQTAVAGDELPMLATIYCWKNQLYAVSKNGVLLTSTDGTDWQAAGQGFVNILGKQLATKNYEEHLHAIVSENGTYRFARTFDGKTWEKLETLPEGFPVKNFSNPVSDEAKPAAGNVTSRLYIVGGETADGTITSSTWSCDGSSWAEFQQGSLPAMTRPAIIQYTLDTDAPKSFWVLWPGVLADGSVLNTPYFSQNKGVTWKLMSKEYEAYTTTSPIDAVGGVSPVMDENNYWMYFFGGVDGNGSQQANVFGGQLTMLTFDKIK